MPKNEFDFEDPMELNGVAFLTEEDSAEAMCECFIEEFLWMGCKPVEILDLFRNPFYLGMHRVLKERGEPYVREQIEKVFATWGRRITWPDNL
jgi:hypothetical protein